MRGRAKRTADMEGTVGGFDLANCCAAKKKRAKVANCVVCSIAGKKVDKTCSVLLVDIHHVCECSLQN